MKVNDIVSKILDNYYKIIIEVFDSETNLIKDRFTIKPHSPGHGDLPKDVLGMKVEAIIVHFDSLVICAEE